MALRKKNRYQTATNFGKDTIFVCNDDSESPFEIGPKSPGKGLLDDRIKRKKRLSVFPVVFAVFVAMCLSLFGYIYYQNLFNPINKKNMVHIQFAPNKEAEFSDYEKYKQTLQERLELFADGRKYFFEETDHYYDVYLPAACFGDARIDNVCRKFLSSTGQIYFVDKEDEQQIFPVEILPQYIESVSKKRVNEKNQSSSYDCLNITLNPEGQKYYAEKLSRFRSLTISRDILDDPGSYKPVYYTYKSETRAFPEKLESFSIKEDDFFPTELELTEYFLTHNSLEHHFDFSVEYPVKWESSSDSKAGNNQVDVSELEEDDLVVVFHNPIPTTERSVLEEYAAIKYRCDMLGRPYAFGKLDEYGAFAIKMPSEGISYPVFKLLVTSSQSLDVHIGSWKIPTESVTDVMVLQDTSGAEQVKARIGDDELREKLSSLSTENPELPIFLSSQCMTGLLTEDIYVFQGTLGEAFDGEALCLNRSCFCDYFGTEEDETWPFEFFRAINDTLGLSIEYDISVGNGNIRAEKVLTETLKDSSYYSDLLNDIKQFAPNAEIHFPDSIDDSSNELYIQLNLEIDEELPDKSLDVAMKIYKGMNLSCSEFESIRIVFVKEEEKTDEWARVEFIKCPVKTLEERNKIGTMGAFLNGRLTPYQSKFRSNLLGNAFYKEMGKNYQSYFRPALGESGWSFSHPIYTSGIHYSVR